MISKENWYKLSEDQKTEHIKSYKEILAYKIKKNKTNEQIYDYTDILDYEITINEYLKSKNKTLNDYAIRKNPADFTFEGEEKINLDDVVL